MSSIGDLIGKIIKAAAAWVDKCLPKYEPTVWNDGGLVQDCNNCYNYGCDMQTNTYAQPGNASGMPLHPSFSCSNVTAAAVADGLVPVSYDEGCGCSDCHHVVALVSAPNHDFHWYRRDRDGRWSHKVGTGPATNFDNSGNIITDPKTANRGPYTVFCGYFCVNKAKTNISGYGCH